MFTYETSPVDWCEPNYVYHPWVAEFWNTLSSFTFVVYGLIGLQYTKPVQLRYCYYILIGIGVTSAYFHATLSHFGQLLDQASIIVFVEYSIIVLYNPTSPVHKLVPYQVASCLLLLIKPEYNDLAMLGVGAVLLAYFTTRKGAYSPTQGSKFKVAAVLMCIAYLFWILDHTVLKEDYHAHWVWHVVIATAGNTLIDHIKVIHHTVKNKLV